MNDLIYSYKKIKQPKPMIKKTNFCKKFRVIVLQAFPKQLVTGTEIET